ncbi:MAG: Response regulator containing a CheY-like receiver domain and an DNA-binding domain [Actinomycetia bacterium]|nr:Response regulator containing a CheY-like receiver domain and an DNA-binding domain [Actinomycetes bacterium]
MDRVDEDLVQLVRRIWDAPCLLVALPSGRVTAVSEAVKPMLGLDSDLVVDRPVASIMRGLWRSDAMRLLLAEAQTGFASASTVRDGGGQLVDCTVSVRMVRTGRRWVFIVIDPSGASGGGTLLRLTDDLDVVAGIGDGDGNIAEVSANISSLLGYDSATLVRMTVAGLIHADDFPNFYAAGAAATTTGNPASLRLRWRHLDGSWVPLRLFLVPLREGPKARFSFVLVPDGLDLPPGGPTIGGARLEEVELRLRRIALEIAALGISDVLGAGMAPESTLLLGQLSPKRQEIVARLQAGERVPTIAEEMFLSQSTIRNHLSATFRHFGVTSQEELVRLLRGTSARG